MSHEAGVIVSEGKLHENATFYCFKGWSLSRKYYTVARGHVSSRLFDGTGQFLKKILEDNGGKWPGLSGPGDSYFRFVVIDEKIDHGWPLMFDPIIEAVYDQYSTKQRI